MKRNAKIAKKSKAPISRIQRELWELCKQIIRKKYGNICYTCGRPGLEKHNWQTGHLLAKGSIGAYLKYDLRILRPQCYHCNINLGGNGAEFYRRMVEREGKAFVDAIFKDKNKIIKAYEHYEKLIPTYTEILKGLEVQVDMASTGSGINYPSV